MSMQQRMLLMNGIGHQLGLWPGLPRIDTPTHASSAMRSDPHPAAEYRFPHRTIYLPLQHPASTSLPSTPEYSRYQLAALQALSALYLLRWKRSPWLSPVPNGSPCHCDRSGDQILNRGIDTSVSLFGLKPCAVSCGVPYCEANPLLAGGVEWDTEVLRSEGSCIGQVDDLAVDL